MHAETIQRIERLRLEMAEAEMLLFYLKKQLAANQDDWVSQQLKSAAFHLRDVESVHLSLLEKAEPSSRTIEQEAYLLDDAEHFIYKVVLPKINKIKDLVTKYGPNLGGIE